VHVIAFVKINEDLKSKGRREIVEGKLSADKVWKMHDALNSVINNDFAEELSKHVYKSKNNQLLSGKQFTDTVDLMRHNMFTSSEKLRVKNLYEGRNRAAIRLQKVKVYISMFI
jgi:predicted HNH restriction endonuclease